MLSNNLERIRDAACHSTDAEFAIVYGDYAFVLESIGDKVVELCPSGTMIGLTKINAEEYIELYLKAYTKLDAL